MRSFSILGVEGTFDDVGFCILDSVNQMFTLSLKNNPLLKGNIEQNPSIIADRQLKWFIDNFEHLISENFDYVAYSATPGLEPCLLITELFSRCVSKIKKSVLIPVNHLIGHVVSPFIHKPFLNHLSILGSGGHSFIAEVKGHEIDVFSSCVDDAPGEMLDKVARYMGMQPHGSSIERSAKRELIPMARNYIPNLGMQNLDRLSFSGIKTHAVRLYDKMLTTFSKTRSTSIVSTVVQECIGLYYIQKLKLIKSNLKVVTFVGGVSANRRIFEILNDYCRLVDKQMITTDLKYCTDNAEMIAWCAHLEILSGKRFVLSGKIH